MTAKRNPSAAQTMARIATKNALLVEAESVLRALAQPMLAGESRTGTQIRARYLADRIEAFLKGATDV